jgi:RNA polymerase sigma-70 factor, ECF subfamily
MGDREQQLKGLLILALDGDATAYRAFLEQLARHLRGFLRRRLSGLPEEVEDLVQETLLAVHNQRHTYDRGQPLTPWVYALARYKWVDLLRRRSRAEGLNDPLEEESELLAFVETEAADARRDIARLLEELPEGQRVSIRCMKIEGLSVRETAQRTGMSAAAVKVAVHRGLKALAARIREHP